MTKPRRSAYKLLQLIGAPVRSGVLYLDRKDLNHVAPLRIDREGVQSGNNVSHAKNRSRRRFLPNLNQVTLRSDALRRGVRLRISANALRSVDKVGGLDAFLIKASDDQLSDTARKIKRDVKKALAEA